MTAAEVRQVVVQGRRRLRLPAHERERRRAVDARKPSGAAEAACRGIQSWRLRPGIDLRDHRPTEPEMFVGRGHERPVVPDALPLRLVRPAPACLRQHRIGTHVGRQPALRLLLQPPLHVTDQPVAVGQSHGHLAAEPIEITQVGRHGAIHAGHGLVDAEVVVERVEPGAVAHDRPAEVGVGLEEEQVRVAGVAARLEVGVGVVADEAAVLVVAVEQPAEAVAAALHGHHDERAGRGHLHVGARRRGREFLDGVVVEIEARAGVAFGGVDAVGRRHLLQLDRAEVVHQGGRADVHHRRRARNGDGFGHGRQLQRRVDADCPAAFDDDPFADQRPEPRQLERDVVRTAPERPEAVRAVDEGNCELRRNQRLARERHRGARHGQPLGVRHRPFNRSQRLPECGRAGAGRQQQGNTPSVHTLRLAQHRDLSPAP